MTRVQAQGALVMNAGRLGVSQLFGVMALGVGILGGFDDHFQKILGDSVCLGIVLRRQGLLETGSGAFSGITVPSG